MQNSLPPNQGISDILKKAFFYWNKTLLYQLVFSLLYFTLFFVGYYYLLNYFGMWSEFVKYRSLVQTDMAAFNKKMEEIARLPQARYFGLSFFVLIAIINPLNVGLYKIYRKIDLKEEIVFNDLFAGYQGFDFFKFFGFYLVWIIIFSYSNALLLGIVWIILTLFSVPLLFFQNVKLFESISKTFKVLRRNFGVIFIGIFTAFFFSLTGLLLCGIGFLLTFPFLNSMIYTLYKEYFKEVE